MDLAIQVLLIMSLFVDNMYYAGGFIYPKWLSMITIFTPVSDDPFVLFGMARVLPKVAYTVL